MQVTTKRTAQGGAKLEVKLEGLYADPEQAEHIADLIRCQHQQVTIQISATQSTGGGSREDQTDGH